MMYAGSPGVKPAMSKKGRRTSAETLLAMLSDAVDGQPRPWSTQMISEATGLVQQSNHTRIAKLREEQLIDRVDIVGKAHYYKVNQTGIAFLGKNIELVSPERVEEVDPNSCGRRMISACIPNQGANLVENSNGNHRAIQEPERSDSSKPRPEPSRRRQDVLRMVRICGGHGDAAYMVRITRSQRIKSRFIVGDLKWLHENDWIKPNKRWQPDKEDISTWYWFEVVRVTNGG